MRKLIIVLGAVVLVAIVVVVWVAANLNSVLNDEENRAWLAAQAEAALGRSVSFGEVGVSLRGGLGVRVADLRIGDDPAFSSDPFVSAAAVDLQVAILPALLGNIEINRVVLRSPAITIVQTARGLSTRSLGDAAGADPAAAPSPPTGEDDPSATLPSFIVANVDISDGSLRFIDKTAAPVAESAIEQLDLRASDVSREGSIRFELEAAVLGASRQNIRITGQVVDLQDPKVGFTLRSSELVLAPGQDGSPADALRDFELEGKFSLPKAGPYVQANARSPDGVLGGAAYRDLAIDFKLQNKIARIEKLGASLFDGQLAVSGRYDMRNAARPRFDVHATLEAMRLEQVVASRSPTAAQAMTGQLGGSLDLAGTGSAWEQIKPSLVGKGSLQLVDGVLKDVNLADTALEGIIGLPGLAGLLPPELRQKYPGAFGVGDTVFENMDAKVEIRDGWAHFRDLRLSARDYVISGQGRYSLDNQLDMSSVVTFSQPLSDSLVEAADPMRHLRGRDGRVEIPVKLVGAPPAIETRPDVAYIAKTVSRRSVGKLIAGALGGKQRDPAAGDASGDSSRARAPRDAAAEIFKKSIGGLLGK